jgi:hypothetical protein
LSLVKAGLLQLGLELPHRLIGLHRPETKPEGQPPKQKSLHDKAIGCARPFTRLLFRDNRNP